MDHSHLEALYPESSRFSEIEEIIRYIQEGNSCQMIAMPGVGRSNLCKFLAYNYPIRLKHIGDKQSTYHFVFVNFAEIRNRPLVDVLKFIFLEIISSLHERKFDEAFAVLDTIFKESLAYQDELVLFQGLKRAIDILTQEKQLTIILLFERFETYIPHLTPDFFVYLRSLRDRAKYLFSVVFSVTRPLEDSVEPTITADFHEFFAGHTVYLTLSDDPGIRFRIAYLEKITGKQLGESCIHVLMNVTGGHGKLTRLGAESMLGSDCHSDSEEEVTTFLLSQKTIQGALQEIWNFLTPSEQQQIIILEKKQQPTEDISFLESIGLVKNTTITIPLFQRFITKQGEQLAKLASQITYDPETNTIKKGSTVISESLTAAEFRLLQFLLENKGKVLNREEIIHAVWKQNATTLGVTDQALDQLIFRLRKKIEENPNNPTYIQTIKGRGIMFSEST